MITPAQYWISGGSLGGGLGRSVSVELGLKVNRSTSENTFVWRVAAPAAAVPVVDEACAFSFSFPRLVADEKALKKLCGSFDGVLAVDGDGDGRAAREVVGKFTLAGWNVARDL
jgi:hypothetical protein